VRDVDRTRPAATRGLGLYGHIRMAAPFSRLLLTVVKLSCEEVFCTGDLVLPSAGGSWFGAGGIVYFCPELLLMMAISKYIVSE
jgi:hypothetical protein